MKKLLIFAAFFFYLAAFAQTPEPAYVSRVSQVSQTQINQTLQEYVNFGVKTTGSANNTNALYWLKNKYASFGYSQSQIEEDPFTYGNVNSRNLVVTKTGTLYPNTYVIVSSHFDSIVGPGANDNGSGTTAVLEMARILKDIPTEYSIKFIHFSGEEQGLRGSQHYVTNVVNASTPKMSIRLVFNLDQIGGVAGQMHNTIICEQDTNNSPSGNNAASAAFTQQLKSYVLAYSSLQTNTNVQPAYSSDYMPFQNNGEIITGFYEGNGSSNPYPHTANDVIQNMDPVYLFNVTKAALGALQHFAIASTYLSVNETATPQAAGFQITPNPAKNFIEIHLDEPRNRDFEFEIFDMSGKKVMATQGEKGINISSLPAGMYLGTLRYQGKTATRKFRVGR
ncbi:M28 family peptidase [Chryseobacterium sp. MFBS3-17]|uniref:M28 family peptidase n=1 Tax=Chryseobacterium sp. MFBS3-17 TaxID=2886689 RepID=UPI001D0EF628|nr:M28 family peptidase [Chryseobacterium sp. MFBS3-17]MCC2591640.1 M28 family peptidase [Chryseobacterium sp. MFBS3-17]